MREKGEKANFQGEKGQLFVCIALPGAKLAIDLYCYGIARLFLGKWYSVDIKIDPCMVWICQFVPHSNQHRSPLINKPKFLEAIAAVTKCADSKILHHKIGQANRVFPSSPCFINSQSFCLVYTLLCIFSAPLPHSDAFFFFTSKV